MPVNRDYQCTKCGKVIEKRTEPKDRVKCPKCKGKMKIVYVGGMNFFMNTTADAIHRTEWKYGKYPQVDEKTGKLKMAKNNPKVKFGRMVNK